MALHPTRPTGPPLNAMRAFEAAARLESFVSAADELCVTAGAVSQQVKSLEGWAGRPLFRRLAHGVELTEAGRALLPHFVTAFDALGAAGQALRRQRSPFELHIAALPSVSQLWLPQRLGQVRAQLPELKVSVTAMETPPNLARELFDLSLFFEPAGQASDTRIELARDRMFPVCAPSLAERFSELSQLEGAALLQDLTWTEDWAIWSRAQNAVLEDPHRGPRYSLYSLAVEEAKAGAGVLMGHASLIGDALEAGSLVRLFPGEVETGKCLTLGLPDLTDANPVVTQLIGVLKRGA